jgi:hypothetical protein
MDYKEARRETIQCLEVREHRYYMGKNLGRDISFDEAFMDWCSKRGIIVDGRHLDESQAERLNEDYKPHEQEINESCDALCGQTCRCLRENGLFQRDAIHLCPYGSDEHLERVHALLGDFDLKKISK